MGAGALRQFVRFETAPRVADGVGGFATGAWATHCDEPCRIERPRSMNIDVERVRSGALDARPVVRIHVRSHSLTQAITPAMRALDLDTGVRMNVNSIQDIDGMGRMLIIVATEGAPV